MTGKELIIYILQNNLENTVVLDDGFFIGFMTEKEAAAKFCVGTATIRAWYNCKMLKGKVVGTIVSTNKIESLVGYKFLEVRLIENDILTDKYIVAVDKMVSAGIGEEVLVTTGSSARAAVGDLSSPVDAVIVGVVDKK